MPETGFHTRRFPLSVACCRLPWLPHGPPELLPRLPISLPTNCKVVSPNEVFRKDSPVTFNAHFVPDHLDHKKVKFNADFASTNKGASIFVARFSDGMDFQGTRNHDFVSATYVLTTERFVLDITSSSRHKNPGYVTKLFPLCSTLSVHLKSLRNLLYLSDCFLSLTSN